MGNTVQGEHMSYYLQSIHLVLPQHLQSLDQECSLHLLIYLPIPVLDYGCERIHTRLFLSSSDL